VPATPSAEKTPHTPDPRTAWYDQCQGNAFLYGTDSTDLVVWTPQQNSVFSIPFESNYWSAVLFPKPKALYWDVFVPSLAETWKTCIVTR